VQFDKAKNTPYKADSHLALEKTIFLDRYMDSGGPALMSLREETWQWKEQLLKLERRKRELMETEVRYSTSFLPQRSSINRWSNSLTSDCICRLN
jgi:hypothetical protein